MENRIIIARDSDINDLDPHNFKSEASYEAVENLYDGLFDLQVQPGPQDTLVASRCNVVGEIVESYTLSPDETTVTLRLRRGVRFSNGTPCTAHSVKFSLERALLGPGYLAALMDMLTVTSPEQITVLDDYTLELRLARANPMVFDLLPLQSFSVMDPDTTYRHATAEDPWASGWYRTHALGAGPYILAESRPGEEYVFAPNPYHWRGKNSIHNAGVAMRIIPNAAERLEALRRGQVDLVVGLVPQQVVVLAQEPGLQVWSFPTTISKFVALNNQTPPLDDVRVRRALAHAVPYRVLHEEVMAGHCQPMRSPVPIGMPTHDPTGWVYETDLERARFFLTEAGYEGGFRLPLIARRPRADDQEVVRRLEDALAPLGVHVEARLVDDATFFRVLEEGYPAILFETLSWVNDPFFHLYCHFHSKGPKNFAHYSNKRVDSLIEEGMYQTDPNRRAGLSQEAQRIILEDCPWLFLYQPHWMVAASAAVKGYAVYPDLLPRYRFLRKEAD